MGQYDDALVKAIVDKDAEDLDKSVIHSFFRRLKSGKTVQVKEHEDARKKRAEPDPRGHDTFESYKKEFHKTQETDPDSPSINAHLKRTYDAAKDRTKDMSGSDFLAAHARGDFVSTLNHKPKK